jgi:hypothetical protein
MPFQQGAPLVASENKKMRRIFYLVFVSTTYNIYGTTDKVLTGYGQLKFCFVRPQAKTMFLKNQSL